MGLKNMVSVLLTNIMIKAQTILARYIVERVLVIKTSFMIGTFVIRICVAKHKVLLPLVRITLYQSLVNNMSVRLVLQNDFL